MAIASRKFSGSSLLKKALVTGILLALIAPVVPALGNGRLTNLAAAPSLSLAHAPSVSSNAAGDAVTAQAGATPSQVRSSVAAMRIGSGPSGMALDTSNGYLYVVDSGSINISVIDPATNTVVGSIPFPTYHPMDIVYDSTNGYLYVSDNQAQVEVLNPSGNTWSTIALTGSVSVASDWMTFDSSNGYIYVMNGSVSGGGATLVEIDGSTNTQLPAIIETHGVIAEPIYLAYDSSDNTIYGVSTNGFIVVSPSTNSVVKSVTGSAPGACDFVDNLDICTMDFNSGANEVYFPLDCSIQVFSTTSNTVVGTISHLTNSEGLGPLAYDSSDNYLYGVTTPISGGGCSETGYGSVDVVSTSTNAQVATLNLLSTHATNPEIVFYDPTNSEIYLDTYQGWLFAYPSESSTPQATASGAPATGNAPLNVTYAGGASGGSGFYSWDWSFGDGDSSTSQSPIHEYLNAGHYNASLNVVDSNQYANQTSANMITVSAPPSILTSVALSPMAPTVSSGGKQQFTVTPMCSATCPSGATYAWALTSTTLGSISPSIGPSVNFTAGSGGGTVGIFVNATLNGIIKMNSTVINITAPSVILTSVSVSPTGPTVDAGGTQTFTANPSCSAACPPGISFEWNLTSTVLGSISPVTGASVLFAAGTTAGTVGIFVNATLKGVTEQSTPVVITVSTSGPTLSTVTVSPTVATVFAGGTKQFTATPTCTGGSCPSGTAYTWSVTNPGISTVSPITGSSTTFTAGSATGTLAIFVNATLNEVTRQSSPVMVTITVPTLTSVGLTPTAMSLTPGGTQAFATTLRCTSTCPSGTTYSWTLTRSLGTLSATNGAAVTFTAGSTAGIAGLFVNATLNGVTMQSAPALITVTVSLSTLASVAVSPASVTISADGTQRFTAVPACTDGPCPNGTTYSWALSNATLGKLGSLTGSSVTFAAGPASGTETLFVAATLNGIMASTTVSIVISAIPTSPGPTGSSNDFLYISVGAACAVVVGIAAVVLLLRMRKMKGYMRQ